MLMIHCFDKSKAKSSLLSTIGCCSYSIYIWHEPIGKFVFRAELPSEFFVVQIIVYCIASVLAGMLSFRLIETPVLNLRNRLYPERSSKITIVSQEQSKEPVAVAMLQKT